MAKSVYSPYFWHWCSPCGMRVTQTHECPHGRADDRSPAATEAPS